MPKEKCQEETAERQNSSIISNPCLPCRRNRTSRADCTGSRSCLVYSPFARWPQFLLTRWSLFPCCLDVRWPSNWLWPIQCGSGDGVPVSSPDCEMPCVVLLVLAPLPSLWQDDQDSLLEHRRPWTEPSCLNCPRQGHPRSVNSQSTPIAGLPNSVTVDIWSWKILSCGERCILGHLASPLASTRCQ